MANPRIPKAKAEITGAVAKNPQRFKGRAKPARVQPLGEPYKGMTAAQCEAWRTFRDELPWLTSSHRAIVQLACVMRARLSADPDLGVNQLQVYSSLLSKLAATPVDESKIPVKNDDEEDPTDKFFTKH